MNNRSNTIYLYICLDSPSDPCQDCAFVLVAAAAYYDCVQEGNSVKLPPARIRLVYAYQLTFVRLWQQCKTMVPHGLLALLFSSLLYIITTYCI